MSSNQETLYGSESPEQSTQRLVEGTMNQLLSMWKSSREEAIFDEPLVFDSGVTLTSVAKRDAALALQKGIEAGEIVFVVTNPAKVESPNLFLSGHLVLRGQTKQGVLAAGIFPSDFNNRCQQVGKSVAEAVGSCLINTLKVDIKNGIRNDSRGVYPHRGKVFNVNF